MVSHSQTRITFTEVDELNNPTSTYIYSKPTAPKSENEQDVKGRVDIAHASAASTSWSISSLRSLLIDVFLPAGYPHSVSEDYVPYQIFDSLQAFSSSIAGLLASRAVLQGVGVGNANASPTSALLLHILQDTSGRIATILFAHRVGTALEPECKMYRFAADIFNDLAMVLDCLSPMIPGGVGRVGVLSAAGVLRALCGVAGGSSKASLSAHFARWGNLAEVNAKDSSQETVISLIGMLVGSLVVSHINGFMATWLTLLVLLSLHLSLNYAAVRSVQMTTLNKQRANIVSSHLLSSDPDFIGLISNQESLKQDQDVVKDRLLPISTLNPAQVSKQERIFDAGGALRWYSSSRGPELLGSCQIGVSLRQFLSQSSTVPSGPNSLQTTVPLKELTELFCDEEYMLFLTPTSDSNGNANSQRRIPIRASILIKSPSTSTSTDTITQSDPSTPNPEPKPKPHLKAWMHALLATKILRDYGGPRNEGTGILGVEDILQVLSCVLVYLNDAGRFEGYIASLREKGWDVSLDGEGGAGSALETRVGRRVVVSLS